MGGLENKQAERGHTNVRRLCPDSGTRRSRDHFLAYNRVASGCAAVVDSIGTMMLMDGVNPPGFEEEIQPGRVKVEFTRHASGGDPDGLMGLTGQERSATQLRMLRSMMVAGGLREDRWED